MGPPIIPKNSTSSMLKMFKLAFYGLYGFVPLAFVSHFALHNEMLTFFSAAIGIVPLAALMGHATEALATRAGSAVGAFLNAALGNAAELIIAIVALFSGQTALVKGKRWSDHNDRATGVVDPLPKQILPESTLLAF